MKFSGSVDNVNKVPMIRFLSRIFVWVQEFLKDLIVMRDIMIFRYLCLYTIIINCQNAWHKNTKHSHNIVYKMSEFDLDSRNISDDDPEEEKMEKVDGNNCLPNVYSL